MSGTEPSVTLDSLDEAPPWHVQLLHFGGGTAVSMALGRMRSRGDPASELLVTIIDGTTLLGNQRHIVSVMTKAEFVAGHEVAAIERRGIRPSPRIVAGLPTLRAKAMLPTTPGCVRLVITSKTGATVLDLKLPTTVH